MQTIHILTFEYLMPFKQNAHTHTHTHTRAQSCDWSFWELLDYFLQELLNVIYIADF